MNKEIEVKVDKLVFGGQGLAHYDGAPAFLWNALPDEQVTAEVTKRHKGVIEGYVTKVVNASPERTAPKEEHFLSCSPWQMMSYEAEQKYKIAMAREALQHIGKLDLPDLGITSHETLYGYRNKMEFSFWSENIGQDEVSLSLFLRGQKRRVAINGCELASDVINAVAREVVKRIRQTDVVAPQLKTLIVRSNAAGEALVGLYVKDAGAVSSDILYDLPNVVGAQLIYSTPKSPASVTTEVLSTYGTMQLTEKVGDVTLRYGLDSFFQVNVPVFNILLNDMRQYVEPGQPLLDLYSGVGSIGLALGQGQVTLVESNDDAAMHAEHNAKMGEGRVTAVHAPSEKALEYIKTEQVVVVDPPRAGLHSDVVKRLLQVVPEKILYVSCNVSTQARDVALLQQKYKVAHARLYNFFPRTPHIESFVVLERI